MDPYSTHIPITALALAKTAELFPDLPIIECGCGDYSSPMIQLLKGKRSHTIYSSDAVWSKKFKDLADLIVPVSPISVHQWGEFSINKQYGLCLMDSEELVVYRAKHIPALLEKCKVVVMHDARANMCDVGKFNYIYNLYLPWTWIGSNSVDVREWFA